MAAGHVSKPAEVGGADGGHDLEEDVVAVAASGHGWLGEPAVELGPAAGSGNG
jgi:hypothetical protein